MAYQHGTQVIVGRKGGYSQASSALDSDYPFGIIIKRTLFLGEIDALIDAAVVLYVCVSISHVWCFRDSFGGWEFTCGFPIRSPVAPWGIATAWTRARGAATERMIFVSFIVVRKVFVLVVESMIDVAVGILN